MENQQQSPFKDISNLKTPKRPSQTPNFHSPLPKFFTASKDTPCPPSSFRRPPHRSNYKPKSSATAAIKKLKAFELEQSQSSRKSQIQKEKSLKALSKSLTVWLNFLFDNPDICSGSSIGDGNNAESCRSSIGGVRDVASKKRDSGGRGFAVWRDPKRRKDMWDAREGLGDAVGSFSVSKYSGLRKSLSEVCSLDDLLLRMRGYLSLESCKEVFDVMTQVAKNIDEGRLKMRSNCPIVTDFGMKEKAIKTLMCYNTTWLRIGLYIIFGGDSLLDDEDMNADQEAAFLKIILERQFFMHMELASAYAYNKKVEGLYRPGYYEALGGIILKRFLLLVLILDRAKSQSSLPLKYGIDGVDGGSPLLFTAKATIKSSRQVIHDFLSSDVMHGEGNLLAHLVIVGYKVQYQQSPLLEYDFRVTDLFQDLHDGVRLCRAIQLLKHDSSVLMKIVVPSDTRKKNQANCGVALQYLRQAGVPLHDGDGMMIEGEDIANGDKELILSLLWNMFVHLQLPLLIRKTALAEEISRIRGVAVEQLNSTSSPHLEMLLSWIQAICESYDYKIDKFSSTYDGKAIWCILDYYFRKELHCSASKDDFEIKGEESIMLPTEYTDAVHNFVLSQKLTTLLGNFPEVLQISDILEHKGACNDQSVIILLVFLASQLTVKKNLDLLNFHKLLNCSCQSSERRHSSIGRLSMNSEVSPDEEYDAVQKFKAIQVWWQNMAGQSNNFSSKSVTPLQFTSSCKHAGVERENAAVVIQSNFRRLVKHRKFMKFKRAVSFLQVVIRAWLVVRHKVTLSKFRMINSEEILCERSDMPETYGRYIMLFADRLNLVRSKASALIIQQATRNWITSKHRASESYLCSTDLCYVGSASRICKEKSVYALQIKAAAKIQTAWRNFVITRSLCNQQLAVVKIQSHLRSWLLRRRFLVQKQAAITVQGAFRRLRLWKTFQQSIRATRSAVVIQSLLRRWIAQRRACRLRLSIITIQKHCRGWLTRREFLSQRKAVVKMQSEIRCLICMKAFRCQRQAAITIQRFVRRHITTRGISRDPYLSGAASVKSETSADFFQSFELTVLLSSVVKLQRWWKSVLLHRVRTNAAVIIQSHIRGWMGRQKTVKEKRQIVLIQKHCRAWLMRRGFLSQREAAIKIQSAIRCLIYWQAFHCQRQAAIKIQQYFRRHITRPGDSYSSGASPFKSKTSADCFQGFESKLLLTSVVKLQRWWKGVLLLRVRKEAAIMIQSCIRGQIDRQRAAREKHCIILIQSYWKGYTVRKRSQEQLLDLRIRMQETAANVDDSKRIINRLLAAVAELLSMKSISGILHTCETLDMATKHSQRCCEELVAAGAVATLLKLIRSVSRSVPDQEVLKYSLSTLRNLARYPHLVEKLIETQGSVETILWQFLRNKEEGYFIAAELLKKICARDKGLEAFRRSPAFLKRLCSLVEELTRKANIEKRNARGRAVKDQTDRRRLREAVELWNLVNGK